ncbi:MAG: PAS domain S-box protein [Spirochaetes bacterium]|nr:PAS domain S-box protein [Spirochaetota bacterium]
MAKKKEKATNLFDTIFGNLRVYSIIVTDPNNRIDRLNRGAEILFEYTAEKARGKLNIKALFPPLSIEKYNQILKSLQKLNIIRREIEMQKKSREVFTADLTVLKLIDDNGKHQGYLYFASDITEHKKLRESVEKQNLELVRLYAETKKMARAKSSFLANMSHELRTPLTAIIGFSELLMDEKVGRINETQKEFINDLYNSARHLLNLINDILDLSKIEAEKMEFSIEKVDLNNIIDVARSIISRMAEQKNLHLIDKLPKETIYVKADESKLKQILYNLYSNAVKFTPEKGQITTQVRRGDNEVSVMIIDTGIGIKKEDQSLIFEDFIQIENPYTKKYAGTGLGLALVRRYLEAMNGSITVSSAGLGKGSKFIFNIPLWEKE